ncbi:hypothetical protein HMPREF1287_01621 [Corynebacterium sp. KPL1986]|nr:hypothetical protein HMPREF1293_02451 [Corynebacterium sp. KPL1996]ERS45112.1 hypothetical protein HMPREF1287_01621 [Corynebacterium sp. KPL1986]ERS69735.1 hypothetical protein HMPREF1300_02445 [Corynebacterium sp. KPL2004]ERS70077.1 hypothetical protein HMPREF1295_02444 [Corynebacterium sp. KPL1998]
MSLGRRMLIIALGTNIATLCVVSAVLLVVLPNDAPRWLIFGNIVVFVACVYNTYKAVTVWPDEKKAATES